MNRKEFEAMREAQILEWRYRAGWAANAMLQDDSFAADYDLAITGRNYWQSLTYEDWQVDNMIKDNQDLMDDLEKAGD